MEELLVILVLVEGDDWDPVLELVEVGVGCVVDQQQVLEMPVLDHSEIFDVDSLFSLPALRAKEAMTHEFPLRIEIIQNNIGVAFVTRREDHNFALLRELFE
jgi:hypothetical protein